MALGPGPTDFVVDEAVVKTCVRRIMGRARKYDPRRPRPVDRAEAHRTGLTAAVDFTIVQLKRSEQFACVAYGDDLGVRCRVI